MVLDTYFGASALPLLPLICILGAMVVSGRPGHGGSQAGSDLPPVRIALLSDTHTNRKPEDTDQGRYKGHLDTAIAQVNAAKVEVVLIAGDLTQGGGSGEAGDFTAQIKGFAPPVRFVPGNHDVDNKHLPSKPNSTPSAQNKGA